MIKVRNAQINQADRDKIVGYLQASARAGQIIAKVTVAKDARPGVRELRVVTDKGASSAFSFEVGSLPETTATMPNATREAPQIVTTPTVINGVLTNSGQRDWFGFSAKKGERLIFNLKGYRLNESAQYFFNPVLYIYDSSGREITKNLGRFGVDPVIDWTAQEDGNYTVLVRDLLWKGSPASVYRLSLGSQPYDAIVSPSGPARPGSEVGARLAATMEIPATPNFTVRVPDGADGVTMVSTPIGDAPLLVRDLPDGGEPKGISGPHVALPAVFHGCLKLKGQSDVFHVKSSRPGTGLEFYSRRLGSPLRVRVVIRDMKRNEIHRREGDEVNDLRFDGAFPSPGEYLVEVSDADGNAGPAYAYSWEALDGAPDFTLTATPDGANVQPGGSMPILVRVLRRDNLKSPIQVKLTDLPPGVTATQAIIPPDDDKTTLVVTAAANAAPGATRITSILGVATGDAGGAARRARILEEFKYNGQPRYFGRSSAIVAVAKDPAPFTVRWKAGSEKAVFAPNKDNVPTATLAVEVVRQNGFQGDIIVYFPTLPPGMYAEGSAYIPKDKTEGAFILHANGDARYLDSKQPRPLPNLPLMETLAVAFIGGSDGTTVSCTPPLLLSGK